nr:hypothetical protein [Tanacetum cinerariifolium]
MRPSPSIESNSSDLQNSNSSISEHEESSKSIMSKPMIKFVKAVDSPTIIKTNKVETVSKPSVKWKKGIHGQRIILLIKVTPRVDLFKTASVSATRRVNNVAPRPNVISARPKTTQDLVIIKLIQSVKRLERELKARTPPIKIHKVEVSGRS